MRQISNKQRAMIDDNRDWREAFVLEIGRCMLCGARNSLCVHEMLPGKSRGRSYRRRECCLVVCAICNQNVLPGMAIASQVSVKLIHDPWYFDLDVIREVYGGGILVTMTDVRAAGESRNYRIKWL